MTNEELAEKIQKGNNHLVPILWDRVHRLLYLKSDKVYSAYRDRCTALSIEREDIRQECYFVFLEALKVCHPPYKFVTFLEFPFRSMISRLLKLHSDTSEIYTESLDELIFEKGLTLEEILPDTENDIQQIFKQRTDSEIIRSEVQKLKGKQRRVIRLYYFDYMCDVQIAEVFGCTSASVCQLRHRALDRLSKSPLLIAIHGQPGSHTGKSGFLNPESFFLKGDVL